MSNDHALLAPSSAARWVQCPGSVAMSQAFPDSGDSEASADGVMAHTLAAHALTIITDVSCDDEEMREAVEVYVQTVWSARASCVNPEIHIESRVPGVCPDNWGTPDSWIFDRARMSLDVFDYKHGHGIVEAFQNWQLINYVAGILQEIGITEHSDEILRVNMHIVQPRAYHRDGPVRKWSVMLKELRPHFAVLRAAANVALLPNAPTVTGSECRYCPARHACPALLSVGYGAIEASGASLPLDMPPATMGMLLRQVRDGIKRLEAIETGLEQQALAAIRGGKRVSGWHVEAGAGRERWRVSYDEVIALGAAMGIEVAKPALITPKQAVKAGLPREVVDCYTETPAGEIKLVADDGRLSCVFGLDTPTK